MSRQKWFFGKKKKTSPRARSHRRCRRDYHTDASFIVRSFLSLFHRDDEDLSDDVLSLTRNELNPSSRDSVREFTNTAFYFFFFFAERWVCDTKRVSSLFLIIKYCDICIYGMLMVIVFFFVQNIFTRKTVICDLNFLILMLFNILLINF